MKFEKSAYYGGLGGLVFHLYSTGKFMLETNSSFDYSLLKPETLETSFYAAFIFTGLYYMYDTIFNKKDKLPPLK